MHPADCPAWEYENHPSSFAILKKQTKSLLINLRQGRLDSLKTWTDTRDIHLHLFQDLTPPKCSYYAGHYRGERFRCLEHYEVLVPGDPRVGYPARLVPGHMLELARLVKSSVAGLDAGFQLPNAQLPVREKIKYAVAVACMIFERFLRIHPYANGNGHAARFCIWAILGRYKVWPVGWPVHPRPGDPPYTELIEQYRSGVHEPLEMYILQSCSA